jgi:RNA polymerase sigma-70 factor (ECF subfamily)
MPAANIARVRTEIDPLYRKDSRRIFATLIRLLGDFERAEEALHDAFRAAMEKWPSEGLPQNPVSWLVSAGRFKSIDKQRRDKRFEHLEDRPDVAESLDDGAPRPTNARLLEDDRLRLVFTCCHPPSRPTRRWRSRCAKSAASPPRKSPRPS